MPLWHWKGEIQLQHHVPALQLTWDVHLEALISLEAVHSVRLLHEEHDTQFLEHFAPAPERFLPP